MRLYIAGWLYLVASGCFLYTALVGPSPVTKTIYILCAAVTFSNWQRISNKDDLGGNQ